MTILSTINHVAIHCCVGALRFIQAMFGQGDGPILLDNLECIGDEERLENCRSNGFGVNNCAHSEDAGVRCMASSIGNLQIIQSIEHCISGYFRRG